MSLNDEVMRALSRFFAVAGDGEAVRFVAHGLQEVQGGAVWGQAEGFAGKGQDEFFHAGFALGAFGDADKGDGETEFFPHGHGHADLAFAAVDEHDIRPFDGFARRFGLLHFAVTASEHFAHGGVVVAGFGGGDVVAAVLVGADVCSSYTTQEAMVASPWVWLMSKHRGG